MVLLASWLAAACMPCQSLWFSNLVHCMRVWFKAGAQLSAGEEEDVHDDLECAELDLGDDSMSRSEHSGSNAKFWESLLKERHQQLLKEEEQQVREQWRSHHLHSADVSPALDPAGTSPAPGSSCLQALISDMQTRNSRLLHSCIMPCLMSCIACLGMSVHAVQQPFCAMLRAALAIGWSLDMVQTCVHKLLIVIQWRNHGKRYCQTWQYSNRACMLHPTLHSIPFFACQTRPFLEPSFGHP